MLKPHILTPTVEGPTFPNKTFRTREYFYKFPIFRKSLLSGFGVTEYTQSHKIASNEYYSYISSHY